MEILGLIPARGGSKGIPGKNLASVAGRPLLVWTCRTALASAAITRTVVSTDSEEIADLARSCGVEVPFLRPAELAADDTPMLPVLQHALSEGGDTDAVVLLQPTSPLRTVRHVDEAVELFRRHDADSVVSIVRVPHNLTPSSLLRCDGDRLVALDEASPLRRQDKEQLFARNGPAVLVVRAEVVRAGSLYGDATYGYEMDAESSVDVDTPFDLELAGWLLERRGASK